MGGTKKNKAKKNLANEWVKQLKEVEFSTKDETFKTITDPQELKNNYLNNLAKLGWAITNLTKGMKKAYNWHGLDKYRFVPIPSNTNTSHMYRGLIASTQEGYTRRNIRRKVKAISRTLNLTETKSVETDEKLNESAVNYRQELTGDEYMWTALRAQIFTKQKKLRDRILAVNKIYNRDDILLMSSDRSILYELINACDKTSGKSLVPLMKRSLVDLKGKWKKHCIT